jgi:cob(I)alamin adenosyltransferase
MGNRLSKLVTKTGDTGMTHFGCDLIEKGHPAIEVLGDIDELNSQIGLAYGLVVDEADATLLESVQHALFNAGGEVFMADASKTLVADAAVSDLESAIIRRNSTLPPLTEFVLPRGSELAARLHVARAVCRRAERHLWKYLDGARDKHLPVARYLNRLSDLLFVMARAANSGASGVETMWRSGKLARTQEQAQ